MKSSNSEQPPVKSSRWPWIAVGVLVVVLLVVVLGIVFSIAESSSSSMADGTVALISVTGMIVAGEDSGLFSRNTISSTKLIEQIKQANDDPHIKAIIFEINSPGGSAVASDEVAQAIKAVNKTTVAWIREVGASGAYWIASSTNLIVANRMSITGSIGVLGSYLEFSGLERKYNVTYQRLVSGKYKDIGSPMKQLTTEEEYFMQQRLDAIHTIFIEEVAKNRNLPVDRVREIGNGLFYLGQEAKELGLVDILGGKQEAITYLQDTLGITVKIKEFKERKSLLDILAQTLSEPKIVVMGPGSQSGQGTGLIQV